MENIRITESPDGWELVKQVEDGKVFYRVFSCWRGGYLDGDAWKMNSGITKIDEDKDYYYIHGNSGSCYRCRKVSYGFMSPYADREYESIKAKLEGAGIEFGYVPKEDVQSVLTLLTTNNEV